LVPDGIYATSSSIEVRAHAVVLKFVIDFDELESVWPETRRALITLNLAGCVSACVTDAAGNAPTRVQYSL
jgi:hypothetical protein